MKKFFSRILTFARKDNCYFCIQKKIHLEKAPVESVCSIYQDVHDGALLVQCKICGTRYLLYWTEYRDDLLDYYCPISPEEFDHFVDVVNRGTCDKHEIRDVITSREVYYRTPYHDKWVSNVTLVDGRPW